MFIEKVGFKRSFESREGLSMSKVKREGVPLCSCLEGKSTLTVGSSADSGDTKQAVVRG